MTEAYETTDDKLRFHLRMSGTLEDFVDTGVTGGFFGVGPADDVEEFVENQETAFVEGVERNLSNLREHGHSPLRAWNITVSEEWPEEIRVTVAEGQHQTFETEMSEEGEEYLTFLEEEYGVPQ